MSWFKSLIPNPAGPGARRKARPPGRRARPELQALEQRVVLYSATGNAWMNPAAVTISFMPDGTDMGGVPSNLFASFNSKSTLANRWQTEILRAAQTWAQQTNLNFVVVPDDGAPAGAGSYQQGDPGHGDIRIGGYNFACSTLARASQPPPINNYSAAGDISFNTGQTWNVGTTYDLYTVALHEIGHALGLDHSSASSASAMYPTYTARKTALSADDIAGIRAVYSGNGARLTDSYGGTDNSFSTAAVLDGLLNTVVSTATSLVSTTTSIVGGLLSPSGTTSPSPSTSTALVTNQDVAKLGQADFFRVTAPAGSGGLLTVSAQSDGLSLLSPKVTVYAADQVTVLGTATAVGQYGSTATVALNNVTDGAQYYVKVEGGEATAFGTGRFALAMAFGGATVPRQAPTVVAYANGAVLSSGGGQASQASDDYTVGTPIVQGISPDTGVSANDGVTSANRLVVNGFAPAGSAVAVYSDGQALGTATADSTGSWTLDATATVLADGTHQISAALVTAGTAGPMSASFPVTIDTAVPGAPRIVAVSSDLGFATTGTTTADRTPRVTGTAKPLSAVTIYRDGVAFASTRSDINGNWGVKLPGLADGTYQLTVTSFDQAGNLGPASSPLALTVATRSGVGLTLGGSGVNPAASATDLVTASTQPKLTVAVAGGAAMASVQVSIDGAATAAVAGSTGTWTATLGQALADGTHAVVVRAVDASGNASTATYSLTVDRQAPAAPTIGGLATVSKFLTTWTYDRTPVFYGTAEPGSQVTIYSYGNAVGTAAADANGNWNYTVPGSGWSTGFYMLTARATDAAGNAGAASTTFPLTILALSMSGSTVSVISASLAASTVLGINADGSTELAAAPVLCGTATASSKVAVLLDGVIIGVASADSTGKWSFSGPSLAPGRHKLSFKGIDAAGNLGADSCAIQVLC